MTRTSRFVLLTSAIAAALAAALAVGAPASAAGITVPSVTFDQAQMGAVETITTEVRGGNVVVQASAPLAQFVLNVLIKPLAIENGAYCASEGPGVWNCGLDFEPTGTITILYDFRGLLAPGTYTVSASMMNNGVTYSDSGTVTMVGPVSSSPPANPPSTAAAAPAPPPPTAGAPAKGGPPPVPGTRSPASSVGPTTPATAPTAAGLTATAAAPTAAVAPSDPTGLQVPVAATVATQRPGHSGSVTTVAVIAFVVAAAGVAAGLFIRRRLRRDRGLPGA